MNKQLLKWGAFTAILTGAGVLLDALFLEKYFFEVKHFNIGSRESHKRLKLVLVTDLHIKRHYWPYYRKLALKINRLQPDLVMITGDMLDGQTKAETVDRFLSDIDHEIPKVAILGNHDHLDDIPTQALAAIYRKHRCELLINQSKAFYVKDEKLMITGLDDFIESSSCFLEAVAGVGWEKNHLLLIHSPLQQEPVLARLKELNRSREAARQINIRYIFAGHNHGGQVRFMGLVPKLPLMSGSYVNGWYNRSAPYLYLSRGFGTSTLPFRFGSRAELTVFNYGI